MPQDACLANQASLDDTAANSVGDAADYYLVFYEGADNSGVFYNTDDADDFKSNCFHNS